MRKRKTGYILLFLLVVAGLAGTTKSTILSKEERKYAVNLLKDTKKDLEKSVKGLSDAQLQYKPAADRWSIQECVQHIALSEYALWKMTDDVMKGTPNPEKRADIKVTDQDLVKMTMDRSHKVKTVEPLYPEKAEWHTTAAALDAFDKKREALVKYMKNTTEDMRNHVGASPVGSMDAYQWVLFIAAHSNRHTQQINEVKMDPGFPKN